MTSHHTNAQPQENDSDFLLTTETYLDEVHIICEQGLATVYELWGTIKTILVALRSALP
jgi:hypothetical protein